MMDFKKLRLLPFVDRLNQPLQLLRTPIWAMVGKPSKKFTLVVSQTQGFIKTNSNQYKTRTFFK